MFSTGAAFGGQPRNWLDKVTRDSNSPIPAVFVQLLTLQGFCRSTRAEYAQPDILTPEDEDCSQLLLF